MNCRKGFDNDRYLQEQTAAILDAGRAVRQQALPRIRRQAALRLPRRAGAARLRPEREDAPALRAEGQGRHPALHLRRRHRAQKDPGRLRHHLRRRRAQADRRPARAGASTCWGSSSPASTTSPPPSCSRTSSSAATSTSTPTASRRAIPPTSNTIVSDEGYGANDYIETQKPLVIVTGPGPGQRQAGHLPVAALSRLPPGDSVGVREVRDLPHLEHPAQAPGQHRLRGGHGRHPRLQPHRPLPPGGLPEDGRQLQPRRRGLPGR